MAVLLELLESSHSTMLPLLPKLAKVVSVALMSWLLPFGTTLVKIAVNAGCLSCTLVCLLSQYLLVSTVLSHEDKTMKCYWSLVQYRRRSHFLLDRRPFAQLVHNLISKLVLYRNNIEAYHTILVIGSCMYT